MAGRGVEEGVGEVMAAGVDREEGSVGQVVGRVAGTGGREGWVGG